MTGQDARHAVELRRSVLMIEQAGRHYHTFGKKVFAVFKDKAKPTVDRGDLHYRPGIEIRHHSFLEPFAIINKIFSW